MTVEKLKTENERQMQRSCEDYKNFKHLDQLLTKKESLLKEIKATLAVQKSREIKLA